MNKERDMVESEQLVQRFVDQELSSEERVRFVVRLGRDEELRQRVIELERLTLDAARLPRPVVPESFVTGVLTRLGDLESPIANRQSVWHRIWAPRSMQWNLASLAAACLALLVAGGVMARGLSRAPSSPGGVTAAAPAPDTTVLVRLLVVKPGARTVQAAGDFNGWNPARTPLDQVAADAWAVTLPLEPGRYEYMFVVDGHEWIADPFAVEQNDDGFGSRNAVLDVRPGVVAPL